MENDSLKDLLVADFSAEFLVALEKRMQGVYKQAHAMAYEEPLWGGAEAKTLLGQIRWALSQTVLREVAAEFGLIVESCETDWSRFEYQLVRCGRFCLTTSHISFNGGLPDACRHRKQYSLINEHLDQLDLWPVKSEPGESAIYAILCHRELPGDKSALGLLNFGFPDEQYRGLAASIPLIEVIQLQAMSGVQSADQLAEHQKVEPRLKKIAQRKQGKG